MRARPYPASEASSRVPSVVATAISAELNSERAKGTEVSSKSSRTFPQRTLEGKKVHSGAVMSCSLDSPLRTRR